MQVHHNSSPLRVGFIGAGFIAQLAHIHSFSGLPGASPTAICDPRLGLMRKVAEQYAIPKTYEKLSDIFNNPDIDALVVCVHRRCLAPLVERALATGKSVLSEKPMAGSVAQAQRLLAVSAPRQTFAVGMMKRFDAGVRRFRDVLATTLTGGEMGDIIHVAISDFCPTYGVPIPPHHRSDESKAYRYEEWSRGPDGLPVEYLDDYEYMQNVACHDINLARWLFGNAMSAQSLSVRHGRMQSAVLETNAFDISLQFGRSDSGIWDQTVKVYFQRGRLELHLPSPLAQSACATTQIFKSDGTSVTVPHDVDTAWAFAAQAEHFTGAARGQVLLEIPGRDSLRDVELIEALWAKVVWRK